MPNVVFRPRVSERTPSKTFFAELCTAPGPQVIGETGDNSFETLFGREWLLEWSVEDDHLRLYQESSTHPGEWERITTPLPPVFDSALPATARRVSFAFDQSARMIVAYEDEGVVKVTRWDTNLNQYIQNVSFAGADPVVVMDATWAYDIPNSDVLIFYLSTERTTVMCRVQRELYAVENEVWEYDEAVILDRATPAFLRYQLLVSDAAGAALNHVLLSDLYPYLASDALQAPTIGPTAGDYALVVLASAPSVDLLSISAEGPTGGGYADPLIEISPSTERLTLAATAVSAGAYADALIEVSLSTDELTGALSTVTAGDYALAVLQHHDDNDGILASVTGPTGGTYATA